MTYLPTDIMKNVLNYCDDRIERKQKTLWESIKIQRVFIIERDGSRCFVEDDIYNIRSTYKIFSMAFHFQGCKDKNGFVWDLTNIDEEGGCIYEHNINSMGKFLTPARFPKECRYSNWISEDDEFYVGFCKYYQRLIFKNVEDGDMYNEQDIEEKYEDMDVINHTESNVENIQDPDEAEEDYWQEAWYEYDRPRFYWDWE